MRVNKLVTILAIETSCDETAASVLRGDPKAKLPKFEILSSVVKSQIKLHSLMGGVVPEVAARAHTQAIRPVVERALKDASISLTPHTSLLTPGIDLIAVTTGPGLIASLLVGVEFAKTLSLATGVPILAVNHMEGHLYSPFGRVNEKLQITNAKLHQNSKNSKLTTYNLQVANLPTLPAGKQLGTSQIEFPILSLIVSGGHTLLVLQKNESHYQVLGSTVDDAAGEAFDKVAKLLGLPYPGGPEISKWAVKGDIETAKKINFPRPMINSKDFDFSFSGLKTAVLYYLQNKYASPHNLKSSPAKEGWALKTDGVIKNKSKNTLHHFNFSHIAEQDKADIALAFETAVVDVLVSKTVRAVKKYGCKTISLSGGVAANKRLRAHLQLTAYNLQLKFLVPDFKLCTDNAEMIAIAGYFKLRSGKKPAHFSKIQANSGWEL